MKDFVVFYTQADGSVSEFLATAFSSVGAITDFLSYCVGHGIEPITITAEEEKA